MYPIHPSLSGRTQVQGQHSLFNRELKLMSAHDREGGEFKVEPGDWSQRVLLLLWFLSQTWLLLFPSDVEAVSCASNVTYGRQCRWIHQTVSRLNTFGSDCNISTIIKCFAVKFWSEYFLSSSCFSSVALFFHLFLPLPCWLHLRCFFFC